jgi:hypothetical protein
VLTPHRSKVQMDAMPRRPDAVPGQPPPQRKFVRLTPSDGL